MSDVSGIPNMGFGGGNFFAPQFSYNPQMSAGQASAAYMPAENYAQNVTNNLFSSGGGFGRQTDYYSGLGANYSAAGMSPYGVFTEPGAGGGGVSYNNVTNPAPLDLSGGGGYGGAGAIDLSGGGRGLFSGDAGGFSSGGNSPTSSGGFSGGIYGGDSFGGFSSGGSSPTSGGGLDWSHIFDFGGGGPRNDPAPGMSMPGGLNSPMSVPFQSPSTDYGTFQGGGGSGYTSGIAPDTTGGRDFEWPAAAPASGMALPGGLGSPMTMPQETVKAQDQPAFDFNGGMAAGGNAPAAMPDTQKLLGYDPQKGPTETDWSTFQSPATNYDMFQAPAQEGGGGGTDKVVEEARQRLADIIGSPETAKAAESPATDYNKFQQPGTAATDALRPPDKIDMSMAGRKDALETLRQELKAVNLHMTSSYRDPSDPLSQANPTSSHTQALAFDTRAQTPAQADAAISQIRELMNARGMVEGRDYKILDEVRNPSGHATGPHVHTQMTEEGMQKYQQSAYDVNRDQVISRPPADIPPPPPPERPQTLPEGASRPSADILPAAKLAPNGQEPEALIVHHTEGRPTLENVVEYWRSGSGGRGEGLGSQYFLDRDGVIHDVAKETGYTGTNHTKTADAASDQGAIGLGNPNTVGIEVSAKNDADLTAAQIAALKQFKAGVFPDIPAYGHSEIRSEKDQDEGRRGAQAILAAQGPLFNFDWSKAPIPDPTAKHSGLELARANIDTPIEKIAMERGGQKAVDQINSMAMGKTPRELLQSYGGLFMSKAEPLFQSLGITRQDFDKAVAMPQTRQDLKMRFGEGGDFGPYPAYTGPEAAPSGGGDVYSQFRQSENVEDRRGELAQLLQPDQPMNIDKNWAQDVAPVPENVLSRGLGNQDLASYEAAHPEGAAVQDVPDTRTVLPRAAGVGDDIFAAHDAAPSAPTSMRDFPSPTNDYSGFQGAASPENRLEAQRAGYAASIRDDPNKSLQLAARLYSEDENNPATRQAILEAMLNRLAASGKDPLDLSYYPKDTTRYNAKIEQLSNDNDLLDTIFQEMERPFGGSNTSNFATDWASDEPGNTVATNALKYATPTWLSPTNEQFYRKDISNDWTGKPTAARNQQWYQTTSGRAR